MYQFTSSLSLFLSLSLSLPPSRPPTGVFKVWLVWSETRHWTANLHPIGQLIQTNILSGSIDGLWAGPRQTARHLIGV